MLTVCRLGEILSPRRGLDSRRAHPLPNFKSGPRTVWLSSPARAIIDAISRYGPDCPFLFPARPPTRQIQGIEYQWNRLRNEAGLPGLRIHDLRHYSRIRLIPDLTAEAGGERVRWSIDSGIITSCSGMPACRRRVDIVPGVRSVRPDWSSPAAKGREGSVRSRANGSAIAGRSLLRRVARIGVRGSAGTRRCAARRALRPPGPGAGAND